MSAQFARTASVCLAVSIAVAGTAGAASDAADPWHSVALDPDDEDDRDDDEDDRDGGIDDGEDDEYRQEVADLREELAELRAELAETRAEFEAAKRELEAEKRQLQAEGEWDGRKDDREAEMEALHAEFRAERSELQAQIEAARAEIQEALAKRQDDDCNEEDHDRGHGNDCDGNDEDNPGNGGPPGEDDQADSNPPDQASPTPTPDRTPTLTPIPTTQSLTPMPTTEPTPAPTPTAGPSPEPTNSGGSSGGSDGNDRSAGSGSSDDGTTPDEDVTVASTSVEIGGFEPVRSVSVNRTAITAGERVAVLVTVENVNDEPMTVPIALRIFGEVVAVENVTVPGKTIQRVRFVQGFDAPGTYHPSVGDHEATVRVAPRSATSVAETTAPSGQVGFGALAALLAVVLGMLAGRRR